MSSKDYWNDRFVDLERSQVNKGAAFYAELQKQYRKAAESTEKEITKWLGRIAVNNEISMEEAKKLLKANELEEFKWTVEEYIAKGETLNYTQKWAKQLENASARWHVSRLEAMQMQMRQQVEELYAAEMPDMKSFLGDIYRDSYYHTAYEVQKGVGVGVNLGTIDKKRVDQIIAKPWAADGSNFSDRIWRQKAQLISELQNGMTQSLIRGGTPEKAIKHIQERFHVSEGQAGRLVMTEMVYFHSAGQLDMYKEMGVKEYEICAVLDTKTSKICQELDGTHRPISEFKPGVTAPPFHCWCRSTTVPYFNDEFTLDETRVARDENGKAIQVPGNMTYARWKEVFVDGLQKWSTLKLSQSSDAWNDRLKKELLEDEKSFAEREKELAVIYDGNGKFLFQKSGDASEVKFLKREIFKMKDGVLSHNHPGGKSFSRSDLELFVGADLSEIRAVVSDGVYYMRRDGKLPNEINTVKKAREKRKELEDALRRKYLAQIKNGTISPKKASEALTDEINKCFCEKYGIKYGKEKN